MIYFLGPQELAEIRDHGRWDEQHRLTHIPDSFKFHEGGVVVGLSVRRDSMTEDEPANAAAL